jgi:hypothetical protein
LVFRHEPGEGQKIKTLADMKIKLEESYPAIEKAANFWDALALVSLISDSLIVHLFLYTNWFFFLLIVHLFLYTNWFFFFSLKHENEHGKKAMTAKASIDKAKAFFEKNNIQSLRSNPDS